MALQVSLPFHCPRGLEMEGSFAQGHLVRGQGIGERQEPEAAGLCLESDPDQPRGPF